MLPSLHARVNTVKDKLLAWWEGAKMGTPCLLMTTSDPSAPPIPDNADLEKYWFDVDWGLKTALQRIASQRYHGVALPYHWPDWGASTFAGVLGSRMEMVRKETFWAYPVCTRLEDVLEIHLGGDNLFARTVNEMMRRSVACSTDHHFVACYPIVGIADILAGLYGTEELLIAMIEQPESVKRAMEHVTHLWLEEFDRVSTLIESAGNPGHMTWMAIWAPGRACALQEDFSYMISRQMYRQFCLLPLLELIDSLDFAMYHLDGTGALTHLDTLLEIPRLRAIQWVPGAGREAVAQWYPLIRRILDAGKSVEVFARPEEVLELVREAGTRGLLIHCGEVTEEEAEWLLEAYPQEE
jgi:hypothetical protein